MTPDPDVTAELQPDPSAHAVMLPDLLRAERLDALLLKLYGPELMPRHRPVLVSQWAKYYFMQLIPAVLAAVLVEGRQWSLQLKCVELALDERGIPSGIRLTEAGEERAGDPFQRFSGLLDDNLQPFIAALSAYGALPAQVLWSSAGDVLETCLTQLATTSDASLTAGFALLTQRARPDGRPNPLFGTLIYIEQPGSAPRRQRKACCLSYQVEWVGRCEHCPRPG